MDSQTGLFPRPKVKARLQLLAQTSKTQQPRPCDADRHRETEQNKLELRRD